MARPANPDAKVKKLEATVVKLNKKLDAVTKKHKLESAKAKKDIQQMRVKMVEKIASVEDKSFEAGYSQAMKLQVAKEKAVEQAVSKFEKAWRKKNKPTATTKKAPKKNAKVSTKSSKTTKTTKTSKTAKKTKLSASASNVSLATAE